MKLVAYLRVSSASQIDAWGLERQEIAIRRWAKTNKHRIVAWCRDEGVSGTLDAIDRPGMSEAIDMIGHGADAMLVADLDRFARELMVQEATLGVIWKLGGKVFTATGGEVLQDDPEDGARTLIRQVLGAVIQYEKHQMVKRMRQGRLAKAAEGKHTAGTYAFGYRGEGKGRERDAAPDPEEQSTVDRIVKLRETPMSYRAVAAVLATEGITTRAGKAWSAMSLQRTYLRSAAVVTKDGTEDAR